MCNTQHVFMYLCKAVVWMITLCPAALEKYLHQVCLYVTSNSDVFYSHTLLQEIMNVTLLSMKTLLRHNPLLLLVFTFDFILNLSCQKLLTCRPKPGRRSAERDAAWCKLSSPRWGLSSLSIWIYVLADMKQLIRQCRQTLNYQNHLF